MIDSRVQWGKLPHDPLGFFGLSANFDRKDLKRAYGSLIRSFKPETHPKEFQLIRAAYEELESQNRYGQQQQRSAQQLNAWNRITQEPETSGGPANVDRRPAKPSMPTAVSSNNFGASVEESPIEHYKRLSILKDKSPQDFFCLAILSDLVDEQDPQRFLKWLLTGIKQFPDDPGLGRLVREMLGADVELETAPSVLLTLSKLVSAEHFYPLTELLWNRLFSQMPFVNYSKLLDSCEAQFKFRSTRAQLAFYIQAFRRMVWTAEADWLQRKWSFVEQHGTEIPRGLDQELSFSSLLFQYVHSDRQRIGTSHMRKQIDEMIRSYCVDPWIVSIAKISQVQDELARNSIGFIETFPAEESEADQCVLLLNTIVAFETIEQSGMSFGEASTDRLMTQAEQAISDLSNDSESIWKRLSWIRLRLFTLPFLGLAILPIVLLVGWLGIGVIILGGVAWVAIVAAIYFLTIKPLCLDKIAAKKIQRLCVDAYEYVWRPRLFRYVHGCRCDPQVAIEKLREASNQLGHTQLAEIILSYASADLGLKSFHLAQCFVH